MRSFAGKTVCFFVKTNDPRIIERNEFYSVDLRILEELGFKVVICTSPFKIPPADLYFIWWWTWAVAPLIVAKLLGKPTLVVGSFDHVMPGRVFQVYPQRPAFHRAIIRWVLREADASLVCGNDQAELMKETFRMSRLEVVPHVLATDVYRPGATARQPFFVTLCWMHADNAVRKCVATSIRAMVALHERLPGFRLLVVGDKGPGYPALAELVEELGAGEFIEFPGLVTAEEKISLLQECTAYLQPTLAEGFGVAILEGMSCGAPVIVSPVGAVPEVVGDCALLVDGLDDKALAEAMWQVATDQELAADLSDRGRTRAVEVFSYDRRFSDINRIASEVMA